LFTQPGWSGIWLGCEENSTKINVRNRFYPGSCYVEGVWKKSRFSINRPTSLNLRNGTRYDNNYNRRRTGTAIYRMVQFSMIFNDPDFNDKPLFYVEYLRNSTRYKHTYNGIL